MPCSYNSAGVDIVVYVFWTINKKYSNKLEVLRYHIIQKKLFEDMLRVLLEDSAMELVSWY